MKRMVVTCGVFLLIVLTTSLSCLISNDRYQKLYDLTEECELAEYSENMEYAIKRLQDYWNKNEWIILTFVNHDQVDEVSLGIIKLEQLCNEESYQLYRAECVAIKESLSHLIKCDRLSLQLFI